MHVILLHLLRTWCLEIAAFGSFWCLHFGAYASGLGHHLTTRKGTAFTHVNRRFATVRKCKPATTANSHSIAANANPPANPWLNRLNPAMLLDFYPQRKPLNPKP